MRELIEGSRAIAEAVLRCRPGVVPAYPITPQTHIVEWIGRTLREDPEHYGRFLTVESEFAAMSAAIGASAVGIRAYTATASQGLLYMAEALFNAAGLGLPIVLTVANRAIGAPINIWNDHSDAMSLRDCGWVQLYARDNQDAVDLHVLAFRLAETLSVPVMVCVDGFVLTHAFEPLRVPEPAEVRAFLPEFRPRQRLTPDHPVTIGAMVGPEAFAEVRYLANAQLSRAENFFPELATEYAERTGRRLDAVSPYRLEGAEIIVVALGSVTGTLQEAIDELRHHAVPIGLLGITLYRPFPHRAVAQHLRSARKVVVLERAFAPGSGGIVARDVQHAAPDVAIHTVIAGLGGRAISQESLVRFLTEVAGDGAAGLTFLDLHSDVVAHELGRTYTGEPSVPTHNLIRTSAPAEVGIH